MSTLLIDLPVVTKDGGMAGILSAIDQGGFYWVAFFDGDTEVWSTVRINEDGYLVDSNLDLEPGQTEPFIVNEAESALAYLAVYPDESIAVFQNDVAEAQIQISYSYLKYPDGSIEVTSANASVIP
jgi:hypothetical protein